MVEPTKKVWMDGEFVDWKDANVPIVTHALHYGFGVFEGMRCYKLGDGRKAVFRLKLHIRRLFDGMKILTLEPHISQEEMIDACLEIVRINDLDECYIRPIVFCGEGTMGLSAYNPTRAAIVAWKWGEYLGEGALQNGIRTIVSSFNRHHVNVGMVQGKITGQYITSILAKREAMSMGYDEAVMLDTHGYVAEGTGENIFAVRDGVLYTPPTNSPILSGVTRDAVIQLAAENEMVVKEERFTRDFLYISDEVFFTGTAAEITPVREIDNRQVGEGRPGPVTKRLQKAFFDVVRGIDERHSGWLDMV